MAIAFLRTAVSFVSKLLTGPATLLLLVHLMMRYLDGHLERDFLVSSRRMTAM
jgi:hypothetical protein